MDKQAITLSQAIEGYFIAARARRLSPHLSIAQADVQDAHRDASPVTNWCL